MDIIDEIANEEELLNSFIHKHAIKLFEFVKDNYKNREYVTNIGYVQSVGKPNKFDFLAKLSYYLASCLDQSYLGENVYNLLPNYDKNLSRELNTKLLNDARFNVVKETIDILKLCSGNLLDPNNDFELQIRNNLVLNNEIGNGSFGSVYLIDGYAVKSAKFHYLDMSFISLVKETTVLSMLGRIKFIGMNDTDYYVGMEYYQTPFFENNKLNIDDNSIAMKGLMNELLLIHSLGIIHTDIKLDNVRINNEGHYKIIDFGSCRFQPYIYDMWTFHGTEAYKDYLLLNNKDELHDNECDIWSMGLIFYLMETKHFPWDIAETDQEQKRNIDNNWIIAMRYTNEMIKGMLSLTKEDRWSVSRIIRYLEYTS